MSSGAKGLIACIAAVVLLGGGVAVMKLTEPAPEPADESSAAAETETKYIYSGNAEDVVSVEVTNKTGGYTLKRKTKASGDTKAVYTVEGLENIKTNDNLVSEFAPNASALEQIVLVDENASELSRFGLDSPAAEVTVTFDGDDSGKITLLVGNDTPAGDVYVKLKDSPAVYTAAAHFIKSYGYEKEYFVSRTVLERPDEYPVISSVKVERPDLEKPIVFEYTGENESGGTSATHVMTSPVKAYLDPAVSVNYTHGLYGLNAASVLSIAPTEQELEYSGINTPTCTVTMTLEDGSEYVLRTGIPYTGAEGADPGYIGYFEGTDVLWKFNGYDIPWVTMKPEDVMSSLVFGSYIYDLKALEINAGGKTEKFEFTGNDADSYTVKLNGSDFDRDRYKSFYQAVIKAPAEEICTSDEGAGETAASFRLVYNNGKPDETIEFIKTDGNKTIIKKDGETCFKCHTSFIEKSLLPNIAALSGDAEFITSW